MKKFRKVMAAVMAVATMAVSVAGLSASAYSPTITKTVSGVTGTLYSEINYATASTSCTGKMCHISLWYGGKMAGSTSDYDYISITNYDTDGTTAAKSWHTAGSNETFTIVF